jgi:signal transduction histidine kinase
LIRQVGLKWKIALSYAALLVVALTATSTIVVWRFDAIVHDQVRIRMHATMLRILAVANGSTPLGLQEGASSPLQVLLNSDNLTYWSSPDTSIEIDNLSGNPLVKTANLGSEHIVPAHVDAAHPIVYFNARVRGEPALVEDHFARIGGIDVVIQVAQSLAIVEESASQAKRTVAVVLGIAIVAVVLLSFALAAQATNPINALSRAMRDIGYERLGRRLNWPRGDEIGALAKSFDDLLARLEAAFARERRFIADASHELRTPLTSINANAQMLLRWGDRDERVRREGLETIAHESSSLGEMVDGMLALARADRGEAIPKERVSLAGQAREIVNDAMQRARAKSIELSFVAPEKPVYVEANANLLRQMISNLVDNAIKFTPHGRVEVAVGADRSSAWVEVRDSGPGIPDEDVERIFERFYRGDNSRTRTISGTGLGLAIARAIARVHGGDVRAARRPEGGSVFRVSLPLFTNLS